MQEENTKTEQTLQNSGFRADDELTIKITGKDFAILMGSSEMLFNANIQKVRPVRYRYYDKEGEWILSPTKEQFESGELSKVFDPLAFMSANNLIDAYVGDVSPVIMEAEKVLVNIAQQGIDQGKAVPFEVLIAEQEEANKSKLEVVE
jgi:hypothetical protein